MDWLMRQPNWSPQDSHQQHVELLSKVVPGTGKWILSNDDFQTWKDPSSSLRVLPLHGILGSGKSMLLSIIIQSIKNEIEGQGNAACIYFYFQDEEDAFWPASVWFALLKQLLQHESSSCIAPELKSKFSDSFQGASQRHTLDYWNLLKAQAEEFQTVYLILDDPDSHLIHDGSKRQMIWDALRKLPLNIKLLFTSRTDQLARHLDVDRGLDIKPTATDINVYVNSRINSDVNLSRVLVESRDRASVVKAVTSLTTKSGMLVSRFIHPLGNAYIILLTESRFLLARLHLDGLSKHGTLADITDALNRLPSDEIRAFESAVHLITKKHDQFYRELAKHVLTWIVHANVGLKIEQVQDSFAIQRSKTGQYRKHRPTEESLISAGAGLVIKDPDNGTLRLVHESAKKYLQKHNVMYQQANLIIAKTCLSYLMADETSNERQSPLLSYAASHWNSHLGKDCRLADPEASRLIKDFLSDRLKLTRAFKALPDAPSSGLDGITGLHAAVYFDLRSSAKALIKAGVDVNARCSDGQTAMHWAVRLGRRELLKYLISKSADTNMCDKAKSTPLHMALMVPETKGIKIVQILVDCGAKVDICGSNGLSALFSSFKYGPTAIAEILAKSQKRHGRLDAEITPGWTCLRELFSLDPNIVKLSSSSADEWRSLRKTVDNHVRYLIGLVLDQDVELNRPTTDGWLPLIHAVKMRSLSRVRHLLERYPRPADVNQRGPKDEKTPLRWAFTYPCPPMVPLLIEHGADVNESNADGWTPLIQAVKENNEEIVWLLLQNGARPDTKDTKMWSALLYAIEGGNKNIVWLLVSKKADVCLLNNKALDLSLSIKNHSIAWLLCENGADANTADDKGMTPLHRATRDGYSRDVGFLLDRGVDVSSQENTNGWTPLHLAVLDKNDSIVKQLAEHASQKGHINVKDNGDNTALMFATMRRSRSIMQTLLQHDASCDMHGPGGLTALHLAAMGGFNDGLRMMMNMTNNVNQADNKGYSALHHAVYSLEADVETIRILACRANHNAEEGQSSWTPLMLAAYLGKEAFVRKLLEEGAGAGARNSKGQTATDVMKQECEGIRTLLKEAHLARMI
ncbi:hypothetical protein QQS21_002828 [Conoideocrella luteorostrata]|uniref:Nephrocystin 3-like N-terminal domain-containing protein n=1 Tax=Conoideocrella luteorostrata TaxID=1105319 RepID=A0AAJ0CUC7_9HYPO|nr:hypothetical protein QQS21_002828 [Conoideocrella luteorostrata]